MNSSLKTLAEILPGVNEGDLLLSLKEPVMHVFDAIIVRERLEQWFGIDIPDSRWNNFTTLAEAIEYCREQSVTSDSNPCMRIHKIGLPQMANRALSENWLLKEIGDMHWEMLSRGLGQPSSEIADTSGNRLYAAFVRIKYSLSALNHFTENETLGLAGTMTRFKECAYMSRIAGTCGDKRISASLMTSFLARRDNNNARIERSMPALATNRIAKVAQVPEMFSEYREIKKGLANEIISGDYKFKITDETLEQMEHSINPHFEINGAGLLYFASYPIIADRCATKFFRGTLGMHDFDKIYHTIHRDIFYFANCNADDEIVISLNAAEQLNEHEVQLTMSMHRKYDGQLMARILTVKQKKS
ncbi:MAG: hypothetical protein KF744_12640 [Taibaiella sp.]|nr:hypothetical protein [Taibaiella sp.]